ncbi:DUF1491 family protein [Erythrobacter sp. R86502]|uniref:DUF1491 family protein n=1 Tax=Erythrobacter sp. R86502 TaxID=3093846 RepID=UPI0036D3EDFF
MAVRLPAHLEAGAIMRLADSQGGFATVLAKGERDAGTILIVTLCRGTDAVLYERMPQADGTRSYIAAKRQMIDLEQDFQDYLARRSQQDSDIWIIEVDIAHPERFIAGLNDLR